MSKDSIWLYIVRHIYHYKKKDKLLLGALTSYISLQLIEKVQSFANNRTTLTKTYNGMTSVHLHY